MGIAGFLEGFGYTVQTASTVREAQRLLFETSPAVVLLDLNLPDGSGLEVMRRIVARQLDARIIVMTALPLANLLPARDEPHLIGWMTKPVAPEQLLERIELALGAASSG
jgi:DNA-binding response OmpR family regulator